MEKWIKYDNEYIPDELYEVIEVLQNGEGTIVKLEGDTKIITIKFGFVDALRICDEGRRIKTYHEVEEIQDYRKDFIGNPLFLVENSQFSEWLAEESAGFYFGKMHYAVMTRNDIVDIISKWPPDITVDDCEELRNY